MAKKYKRAFKCSDCPGTNSEDGCPAWVEFVEENVDTGELRITKDCALQMWPKMSVSLIKATATTCMEVGAVKAELHKAMLPRNNEARVIEAPRRSNRRLR